MSNAEMSDRIVNARVSVYSGSDDHAKHEFWWAVSGGGVIFRDDAIWQLDKLLTVVAQKGTVTDEMQGWAIDLLHDGFIPAEIGTVLNMEIERETNE
jgi:hypothetical protein